MQSPKQQMFNKTDLAKFMNIRRELPHVASAGGQKSFAKFAEWASAQWEKNDSIFNEAFFRQVVAMAIIFRQADRVVKSQIWYNSYKANIVAYTISLIIYTVRSNYQDNSIDYKSVWQRQGLSSAWVNQIEELSKVVYEFLIDENRTVENVTEWAKRESCWERAKKIQIDLLPEFVNELIYKHLVKEETLDARKEQRLENKVNTMVEVANFGIENWKSLLRWNDSHSVLSPTNINFIKVAIDMEKGKFPTEKQCAIILKILQKAREEGFPG